jgi:hypothetical protein
MRPTMNNESRMFGNSEGREVDDNRVSPGEHARQFDHVLGAARIVTRLAIPQGNEGRFEEALRQCRIMICPIAK